MTREEDRTPKEQVEPAFANETAGFNLLQRCTRARLSAALSRPSSRHPPSTS